MPTRINVNRGTTLADRRGLLLPNRFSAIAESVIFHVARDGAMSLKRTPRADTRQATRPALAIWRVGYGGEDDGDPEFQMGDCAVPVQRQTDRARSRDYYEIVANCWRRL
jgi:hypothetical protein